VDAEIDIAELLRAIDAGDPLLLLDVRNEHDFTTWRIEGRHPVETLHVPFFVFLEDEAAFLRRLPPDRTIVVVCAHGGSSAMIADFLRSSGFTTRNLAGGMAAYGDHLAPVAVPLHADDAGRFAIWQLRRRGRGCLSYVIHAGDAAAVVDPSRHVERYETFVHERGARITMVLDSHVHADHLSGGVALAARSNAPYFVGATESCAARRCASVPPATGRLVLAPSGGAAAVALELIATPGHTPDALSILVAGRYLLSGDTLLASGVGRPDLGQQALAWGRELHRTLHERLAHLHDETRVLPAHGTTADVGPDGVVARRLGELRALPELRIASRDEFARTVASSVAPPPPGYARIVAANVDLCAVPDEEASELEIGPNHCAASTR
jgi:glyoxylase-like metal-dependent hydrolase (beta-lactamase superfamily II)